MMCHEMMTGMKQKQDKSKLQCPIQLLSKCHPKSPILVHVDGNKSKVYLSCSKCERVIATINVKGKI